MDVENLSSEVLRYVIREHQRQIPRFDNLMKYYMAQNTVIHHNTEGEVTVIADYPRYIVDSILGFYLGDPVKYDAKAEDQEQTMSPGAVRATVKNGAVVKFQPQDEEIDIAPVVSAYNDQTIAEVDANVGKGIGIFGEMYELEYASDDPVPVPKSTARDPRVSIMVRDNSVEHRKLFFITYEKRKKINDKSYYAVYVYTDKTEKLYRSDTIDLSTASFIQDLESERPHFFGEVPAVEYQNNSERLGDFETALSLIDAYNNLLSNRCTDKNKFIDAILVMYGMTLRDDQVDQLKTEKMIDQVPEEARIEYIQKVLDENSVQVLADNLTREIHKQTMTVDMTDEQFAGNSSGQALKLKLLTMTFLVKNKIRNFEKGLRKRFEMYNHWLSVRNVMPIVSKNAIDPVFTVSMPINESEIVTMVKSLQGIVDDETLLNQLWFVKDAASVLSKVRDQREEEQRSYLDTFGITAKNNENIGNSYDEEDDYNFEKNRTQGTPE